MINVMEHIQDKSKVKFEEKMRIHAKVFTNNKLSSEFNCFNEFVVDRGEYCSLLKIDVYCNDALLTKF